MTIGKLKRNKDMDVDEFVYQNEQELVEGYLDSYPYMGYKINDGDMEHFYNHIDWDYIDDLMEECKEHSILAEIYKDEL